MAYKRDGKTLLIGPKISPRYVKSTVPPYTPRLMSGGGFVMKLTPTECLLVIDTNSFFCGAAKRASNYHSKKKIKRYTCCKV